MHDLLLSHLGEFFAVEIRKVLFAARKLGETTVCDLEICKIVHFKIFRVHGDVDCFSKKILKNLKQHSIK